VLPIYYPHCGTKLSICGDNCRELRTPHFAARTQERITNPRISQMLSEIGRRTCPPDQPSSGLRLLLQLRSPAKHKALHKVLVDATVLGQLGVEASDEDLIRFGSH